jgi:hypothetical protein
MQGNYFLSVAKKCRKRKKEAELLRFFFYSNIFYNPISPSVLSRILMH